MPARGGSTTPPLPPHEAGPTVTEARLVVSASPGHFLVAISNQKRFQVLRGAPWGLRHPKGTRALGSGHPKCQQSPCPAAPWGATRSPGGRAPAGQSSRLARGSAPVGSCRPSPLPVCLMVPDI